MQFNIVIERDENGRSFERAGWQVNHVEGSHYILVKVRG